MWRDDINMSAREIWAMEGAGQKWHKKHLLFLHAIVTGFRFPVPFKIEKTRSTVLAS